MARGQVTIEFVLILIVVLVIVSTISIPLISYTEENVRDIGGAIVLSQEINKIVKSAEDLALSGCGSSKTVYIDTNQLDSVVGAYSIKIKDQAINASFYLQNGTRVNLKPVSLPQYIAVSCNGNEISLSKDCTTVYPDNDCEITNLV